MVDILPAMRTDHSAVILKLNLNTCEPQRGRGYWKFNSSLLSDVVYTNEMKANIVKCRQSVQQITDSRAKWEFLKFNIRDFTINYSKSKSKKARTRENKLLSLISDVEKDLCDENIEYYSQLKQEMDEIERHKAEGLIIRSKVRWYEHGEKSSKHFFNLEKRNQIKKKY
jgi:hypothetical protein